LAVPDFVGHDFERGLVDEERRDALLRQLAEREGR
jgi:hypothetical protein